MSANSSTATPHPLLESGKVRGDPRADGVHLRDGLLQCDSGLQFREGAEPVEVAGHVLGLEHQRPPDLREGPVEALPAGSTPITVYGRPSRGMARPTTAGSAPNCESPQRVAQNDDAIFPG